MNWNPDLRNLSPKTILVVLGIAVLSLVLVFGTRAGVRYWANRPLPAPEVRLAVTKYLLNKAGRKEFKPPEFGDRTNLLQAIKAQYERVPDYKTVYRLIGEHLQIAEKLLNSSEPRQNQLGLRLAMELSDTALRVAVDNWLAANICEGYLLGHVDKAEERQRRGVTEEQLILFASRIFRETEAMEKQISLYKTLISKAANPNRADAARLRLADILETRGDNRQALQYLREISSANHTNAASRRIAMIERKTRPAKSASR